MQAHEERVIAEKSDLDEKLSRLAAFCSNTKGHLWMAMLETDKALLLEQSTIMARYSAVLSARIFRFKDSVQV